MLSIHSPDNVFMVLFMLSIHSPDNVFMVPVSVFISTRNVRLAAACATTTL